MNMKKSLYGFLVVCLVNLVFMSGCFSSSATPPANDQNGQAPVAPESSGQLAAHNRIATFDTSQGVFKIQLFEDKAPLTTKNFVDLVNKGFYNGLIFHRVIDDFMIQGGDPQGNGTGGPGYTIKDEFSSDLKFDAPGILAMANAGPDTGGSQFFITLAPTPWLNNHHAIFGKVVEGFNVVQAIGKVNKDSHDKPLKDVVIKKITVE
jgi:peptidyl-prolyl cis-trans isomerase A (cyclophilin A)